MPTLAILAGGLATRLRPITVTIPKAMVTVAGEPFVAHQLRMMRKEGFREVVLLCGHLGEQIQAFVGDGGAFGLSVRYSFDGEVQRGTGGAILQAMPLLGDHFMVMYGDSYCPTNYPRVYGEFRKAGKLGLMTVFRNENLWDKSNVIFEDGRIVRYDKTEQTPAMRYIDYGVSCFAAAAFAPFLSRTAFDLAELQVSLVAQDQLAGCEVYERFYEIGSHAGLAETEHLLTANSDHEPTSPKEENAP